MATSLSSKKRVRQNSVRRERNRARKQRVKSEMRKFTDAVHDGKADAAGQVFVKLTKLIDQTAAKGTLHKNAAARKKSRLARRLNQLSAKK